MLTEGSGLSNKILNSENHVMLIKNLNMPPKYYRELTIGWLNPFTTPEDPFDEEVQQPLAESQDSKIYNLLKPVALVAFSIVFVVATVSLFTRPSTK